MRKPPTVRKERRRESSPRATTDSSGTQTNTVLEAASAFVTQPAGGEERPTGENEESERQRKRRKAGSMSAPISQRSQSSKAEMMERPLQSPAYYRLSRQSEPDTGANRFVLLYVEKKDWESRVASRVANMPPFLTLHLPSIQATWPKRTTHHVPLASNFKRK